MTDRLRIYYENPLSILARGFSFSLCYAIISQSILCSYCGHREKSSPTKCIPFCRRDLRKTVGLSQLRSRRLAVRTPGFHPGNRSSILRGITKQNASAKAGAFCLAARELNSDCQSRKTDGKRSAIATEARRCLHRALEGDISEGYSPRDHHENSSL